MTGAMTGATGQTIAARPALSVWVGASAGTGKTKVLADRVLRLLLSGTAPERILCLTFTRAAAAEMANRIFTILGAWARAEPAALAGALTELLEAAPDAAMLERARSLFLVALDTPGGMKIQTIHSFCETVLGRFPLEARIAPNFEVMDERTAWETLRAARDRVIGDTTQLTADAMAVVTTRLGEDRFDALMSRLAQDRARVHAMAPPEDGAIFRYLGLDPGQTVDGILAAACSEEAFDGPGLQDAADMLATGKVTDRTRAERIAGWLAHPATRAADFRAYAGAYLTKDGKIQARLLTKGVAEADPAAVEVLDTEARRVRAVRERCLAADIARTSTALATLARVLLGAYDTEKSRRARLDYDDLIARVRRLLEGEAAAAWVLYKLDGGIDHVLIDEAQDTNPAQWAVIRALAEEFFSGLGGREMPPEAPRTVFAVGDPKQSIFSFQGAEPDSFAVMGDHFRGRVEAGGARWETVALEISFRSTAPVLQAVDAVFADPDTRRGLGDLPICHAVHRIGQAGLVVLWPPAEPIEHEPGSPFDPTQSMGTQESGSWRLAAAMAESIAGWIKSGEPLPSRGRPIRAGDIMVLVRRRTEFVEQLIRALKILEVGVAGIDRLVLSGQLAVMDLLAIGEAALLPDDDLTLATVLKGPLFGLDEQALFDLAHGRGKTSLAARLAELAGRDEALAADHALFAEILAIADFVPPFEFYMRILAAMGGRARILARLGPDAEDPIDEFLGLALDYEREHPPSLQGFLSWFRAAATEVKRDLEQTGRDEVRVMTVHGAKGLEAPIVILADTMQTPDQSPPLLWPEDGEARPVLLWRPGKDGEDPTTAALRAEAERRRDEEYLRLLYVAMTRAQDQLHICGYLTKHKPRETCWYRIVERALGPLAEPFEMTLQAPTITPWSGPALRLAAPQEAGPDRADPDEAGPRPVHLLPDWATRAAPREDPAAAPAAPSHLDQDTTAIRSPFGADGGAGFRRGRVTHDLLQAVADIAVPDRARAIAAYLARPAVGLAPAEREGLAREVQAVLCAPEIAPLFGPGSLAEVPIAGRIGGRAFSGRIDRLLIGETGVELVDFKTNRAPPARPEDVPAATIRQLAAYRALLQQIYPGRRIGCALIWTVGPRAMAIPAALLDGHAP